MGLCRDNYHGSNWWISVFESGAKVHADQANQATATQQDQSDRSTVSNDSLASTSVAAEPDSANLSVQSQATTSQAATSEATTSQTTDSIGNSTSTETSSVSASKPSEQVSNAPVESAQVAPVSQTTSSQASVASATQSEATGSQVVTSQQPQVSEKSVMPSTMTLAAENGETFNANVTDPDYPAGKWQDPNSDHYTFGYLKTDGTSQPVENVVFSTNRNGDGTVYIYEFDAQNNLLNSYTLLVKRIRSLQRVILELLTQSIVNTVLLLVNLGVVGFPKTGFMMIT